MLLSAPYFGEPLALSGVYKTADYDREADMANQVGDVVMLKGGGPKMTVTDTTNPNAVRCAWFDGGTLRNDVFNPAVLTTTKSSQPKGKKEQPEKKGQEKQKNPGESKKK